jgi:exodeoxyribonuclease VII small subunit
MEGIGMPEEMTFEQALKSLEEAVAQLEKGQMPLDESLDCFEAGVQSANLCRKKLQAVESRVETLMKNADGSFATEPFGEDGGQD